MLSNTMNSLVSHNITGSLILIIYSVYLRGRYLHMHQFKLISNRCTGEDTHASLTYFQLYIRIAVFLKHFQAHVGLKCFLTLLEEAGS